jgi:hypothetical protein
MKEESVPEFFGGINASFPPQRLLPCHIWLFEATPHYRHYTLPPCCIKGKFEHHEIGTDELADVVLIVCISFCRESREHASKGYLCWEHVGIELFDTL